MQTAPHSPDLSEPRSLVPYSRILIAASLLEVAFMALHPVSHAHSLPDLVVELAHGALYNRTIHSSLCIISAFVLLGLLGLVDRLGSRRVLVRAGLIFYICGFLALVGAAITNGLVLPGIIPPNATNDPALAERLQPLLALIRVANQSLAQAGVVATALAICLWSVQIIHTRLGRPATVTAALALLIFPTLLALLFLGRLPMSVHGFGLFVLCQTAWNIAAALQLPKSAP